MPERLRLGLIGAGTWAIAAHLPAFAARDDVEPLIVCRRDAALLEQVRARFGFPRATTDWREVIEARPDLVVLAGPSASGRPRPARPRRPARTCWRRSPSRCPRRTPVPWMPWPGSAAAR